MSEQRPRGPIGLVIRSPAWWLAAGGFTLFFLTATALGVAILVDGRQTALFEAQLAWIGLIATPEDIFPIACVGGFVTGFILLRISAALVLLSRNAPTNHR